MIVVYAHEESTQLSFFPIFFSHLMGRGTFPYSTSLILTYNRYLILSSDYMAWYSTLSKTSARSLIIHQTQIDLSKLYIFLHSSTKNSIPPFIFNTILVEFRVLHFPSRSDFLDSTRLRASVCCKQSLDSVARDVTRVQTMTRK